MSAHFSNFFFKSDLYLEQKPYVDVNGVRITPPFMIFKHAFEGRIYKQKVSIQNIGKSKVLINLTPPSSYAFKINCINGQSLSPGLCLVRELTYVYTHITSTFCTFMIYINGNPYEYHVIAKLSAPEISFNPKIIDFGLMDSDTTSQARFLVLRNDGSKIARFFIDAAGVDRKLVAEPRRGIVQPRSSVSISLQVFSSKIGHFNDTIWIACDKPYVIPFSGEVIEPKFEPANSDYSNSLILIDFSATYVGVTNVQTVYVRNHSASQALYCLMGEVVQSSGQNDIMDLQSCREVDEEFAYFDASPKDGTCEPKELKVFQFRYTPTKPKHGKNLKSYHFCMYHVSRIKCKSLTPLIGRDEESIEENSQSMRSWSNVALVDQKQFCRMPSLLSGIPSDSSFTHYINRDQQPASVKFYLHGIPEVPSVTIVPDELTICNMLVGDREIRVLEFKNNSCKLPIIVAYKKIPFIDVEKNNFLIEPRKAVQMRVFVAPQKIGSVHVRMHFDLIYYDYSTMERTPKVIGKVTVPISFDAKKLTETPLPLINRGITPNYVNEVGKFCQDVKFKTQISMPRGAIVDNHMLSKTNSALIAFPNDTTRSIRPWRRPSTVKTIFTKAPRHLPPLDPDYELTVFGRKMKTDIMDYYTSYMRKREKRLQPLERGIDYDLTKATKLMCSDLRLRRQCVLETAEKHRKDYFIPLSPLEMNNINITPSICNIGTIAAHSRYDFDISIKNLNPFAIRIYVKPEKPNILFIDGNRKIIRGDSEITMTMTYVSSMTGYYTTCLDIIVNECGVFEVVVMADVIPVYLTLDVDRLEFGEETIRLVEICNPTNKDTRFKWSLQEKNFQIEPKTGLIRAKSVLMCQVIYLPKETGPSFVEVDLLVGEVITQHIGLFVRNVDLKLSFIHDITFLDMPLNIPVYRMAILKNDSTLARTFTLVETDSLQYITVYPKSGVVYGNSYIVISLTMKIRCCVEFAIRLKFSVGRNKIVELPVTGNVVYPDVTVVPETFKFDKIPSSSVDTIKFLVENRSKAIATVRFDMHMYHEYKITESGRCWDKNIVEEVTLEKNSVKYFFMHFQPKDALCDKFVLPIIINDILGPAFDDKGLVTSNYLGEDIPEGIPVKVPNMLLVPTIESSSTEAKLYFSKLSVHLYYKVPPYSYDNTYEFRVCNNCKEDEAFCIRTDALDHPFYMTPTGDREVIIHKKSIECHLAPGEEVTFRISFEPDRVGYYRLVLPIFIRSDMSANSHNTLYVTGEFQPPSIAMKVGLPMYKPAPLCVRNNYVMEFNFDNHFSNCVANCSFNMTNTDVELLDAPPDVNNNRIVRVKISRTLDKPALEMADLRISCTCDAICYITIRACRENCFLTNYAQVVTYINDPDYNLQLRSLDSFSSTSALQPVPSLISLLDAPVALKDVYYQDDFFPDYPFFPNDDNNISSFMYGCVQVVENWIYSQGFFGSRFYKIPSGISFVIFNTAKVVPPFIQLLINLVGSELEDYLGLSKFPHDEIGKIEFLYTLYSKALDFLKDLGAFFTKVTPLLLLEFTSYGVFLKHHPEMEPDVSPTDREAFYRLTKQTWLDLILQTYKVLVLNRLFFGGKKVYVAPTVKSIAHERYTNSIKDISRNRHLFTNTELLLLNWLEFHYNDIRRREWADNDSLHPREIAFFGQDMEDGFVYAAVMLAYCPYLLPHFKKLYNCPSSYEEYLHNNINIVQSWGILNFSLGVTADEIVDPHPMRTLFIVVYLYQMLPNMYPVETIEFNVGLSQRLKKSFIIRNTNEFRVCYKPILYGNDTNCFQVEHAMYSVPPKGRRKIEISYWGRFVRESQCTLILSGEIKGNRYAKSIVINLVGITDVHYKTDVIDIVQGLYTVQQRQIKVVSPYTCSATYKLQFNYGPCSTAADVDSLPCRANFPKCAITRALPMLSEVEFNEEGEAFLDVYTVFLSCRTIQAWLYFRNPQVGDFCVVVQTLVGEIVAQEILEVPLPRRDTVSSISCKKKRSLYLRIPSQNRMFWDAIKEFYLAISKDDEEFWRKNAGTDTGMHILQRVIRPYAAPSLHLCRSVKYKLKAPKNCGVAFPEYLEIKDDCCTELINVPITIQGSKPIPSSFNLLLESEDKIETRSYRINFRQI